MPSITETAEKFVDACDNGKGWDACQAYCLPDASFSVQADALADVTTLQQYTEWAKGLLTPMPDTGYELKSLATDENRQIVTSYAVFSGTHTGEGGPLPPTGKNTQMDYVYAMEFDGDEIRYVTKIWNDVFALKGLGWM